MLKVYQFGLSKSEGDLVNSKGWNASLRPENTLVSIKVIKKVLVSTTLTLVNVQSNELEEHFT